MISLGLLLSLCCKSTNFVGDMLPKCFAGNDGVHLHLRGDGISHLASLAPELPCA
jgi:hypothetical protein